MEFGRGMKAQTNYAVPDPAYYLQHGVQLVRVPVQIDRLVPDPGHELNVAVLQELRGIVAADTAAGAITVVDPHGYGYMNKDGHPRDILTDQSGRADYVDLMRRLGQAFAGDGHVALGLMNEPHAGGDPAYIPIWNDAIAAIRQSGFHGTVLVPHAHWSAASDISPARPFPDGIVDLQRNWVLELHSYLDPDGTGTYRQAVLSPDIGVSRLAGAIAWSRQSHIRIFLGETGGPASPIGVTALANMFSQVAAAPDVFWGVALWGAGPWWKPNYPMRLDPIDHVMRPQMAVLEHQIAPEQVYLATDPDVPEVVVTIRLDGRAVADDAHVQASRLQGPQAVPVMGTLPPGCHVMQVVVHQSNASNAARIYLVGSTWKDRRNSDDAFAGSNNGNITFHVRIPGKDDVINGACH
ncbi:cellulase family glycosylhydrolase [Lichenicola cladoniae]|uniref:Cellulase family glycosylhydrolase n=1 Tax=Lichenicola cladoniae TaxID=1484109 RepID=A0A6M8HRP6_9PROT|nr:cellulase family glycosylhydrolase [Lichenicola cladoniae]NPD69116.1 cellulase family glycosylhydrolase [Acetobacteraceae bacterium]QKE90937.1 cellulase family glycosylhydrolase [Lichenicola cladoniae]